MPNLLEELRARRVELRNSVDEVLTRASTEQRDLSPEEWVQYRAHQGDLQQVQDRIEELRDQEMAELRARVPAGRGSTLTRADQELARQFRSAIYAKNPQPIEVYSDLPDEWPDDLPEVQSRVGRVQVHTRQLQERDTLKSTATQALSVDTYTRIVQHLVETSSLMAAGATVVTTATGEDLIIPKSTGFVTSNIIGEGTSITESDPTLSTVTLKAFKYANYFEVSQELANDTPTNLLDFLARQAALSLGLGAAGYGDDIINGTGTTQPRGLLLDAATGVTGPAGTGTSLGTQGTANQGTDALWNLVGSVAEPYASAPSSAFLLRNASDIIIRKLRDTTGQPVQGLGTRGSILGYPSYLDPFMPAMANTVESIAFGDMSKYFIRIVNGVRFERSDEFRFQDDLIAFRCILRLDGALVDLGAVRTFVNTT
jgi:HK97 family phage major capsid protein